MPAQLKFPPGVATAAPFTSVESAVAWLSEASSGRLGDFTQVPPGGGFAGRWSLDPVYSADLPGNLLMIDGTGDVHLCASINPPHAFPVYTAGTLAELRRAMPDTAVTLAPEHPPQRPQVYLDLYRVHLGYEEMARAHFDALPTSQRRPWAPNMGYFEQAVTVTAAQFVVACNAWVTAVWIDAVNAGLSVTPDSLSSSSSTSSPVGTLRLPSK